jgi:ankyrin repeat protein
MHTQKIWITLLVGLLMTTSGCAETKVEGKSAHDFFADERVVMLVKAAGSGDFAEADQAIKSGADINTVGAEGMSPLLWVMGTTLNVRKIEYMLKAGANPNYRETKGQLSPMYLAAGGDRIDILELLLKHKGDPNLLGPRDETMLMVAVSQFRDKNIELLLKYGADINHSDQHNHTVANDAATYGRYDLVAEFLELGLIYNLQGLARTVDMTQVPADSKQQHWKEKVIEMLKARGAKFPAFIPHKVPEG